MKEKGQLDELFPGIRGKLILKWELTKAIIAEWLCKMAKWIGGYSNET